jgi:uncharacterized protein (UPF0297 family)
MAYGIKSEKKKSLVEISVKNSYNSLREKGYSHSEAVGWIRRGVRNSFTLRDIKQLEREAKKERRVY